MSLTKQFQQAVKDVLMLPNRPGNDDLLNLYALYKQATAGDVSGPKPGMLDFKGKAKYESWKSQAGLSKDKAIEKYIALVKKLQGRKT